MTSKQSREGLNRSDRLGPEELKLIKAEAFVPNTRWKVVVLENQEILNNFRVKRLLDAEVIYAVLVVFWVSVLWLGIFYENRRQNLLFKLNHQNQHDVLTGLANRRMLAEELNCMVEQVHKFNIFGAILYLDLNDFKQVNDSNGHKVGDLLLIEFSKRLAVLTRDADVIARVGGDEFVLLLKNLGKSEVEVASVVNEVLDRMKEELNDEYKLGDITLKCTPSIGVVIVNDKDLDVDSLLKRADKDMYQHKKQLKKG